MLIEYWKFGIFFKISWFLVYFGGLLIWGLMVEKSSSYGYSNNGIELLIVRSKGG